MEEVQGVTWSVRREAGLIFEATREDQFCCTAAKRGNLLLRMRRGCVGRVSYHQNDVWGETG